MWSEASFLSRWAAPAVVVLASSAGAGYAVQAQTSPPVWRTGGSGDSGPRAPLLSDVVPSRAQQLMRLQDNSPDKPFDVLIIGGGATGTGCAVDAATRCAPVPRLSTAPPVLRPASLRRAATQSRTAAAPSSGPAARSPRRRGLRTALVERGDWASGTSSKSTKLVHGGVRYLEKAVMGLDMGQLKLVYEALHERKVLLDNAPHLSYPLPILTVRPRVRGRRRGTPATGRARVHSAQPAAGAGWRQLAACCRQRGCRRRTEL